MTGGGLAARIGAATDLGFARNHLGRWKHFRKRPVLVPVSAHGSARERKLRLGVHDALDDGE
jgi:hypothetical protein